MARIPENKNTTIATAENAFNNDGFYNAAIIKVDSKGDDDENSYALGTFLLNPASWEENKSTNWASVPIPGQSDPILQWVSGGERSISFDALVTRDTYDFAKKEKSVGAALANAAVNAVGSIASNFLGANVPAIGSLLPTQKGIGADLGISDKLNYYRSLLYPNINTSGKLLNSPPLVMLYVGDTFSDNSPNNYWIVKSIKIRVTKQLPNLTPMEASVNFQLVEYITKSKSISDFSKEASDFSSMASGLSDIFS